MPPHKNSRPVRRHFTAVALLTALAAPVPFFATAAARGGANGPSPRPDAPGADACPRKAARVFEADAVVTVGGDFGRCALRFRPTGARLKASPEGSWPDPGISVVRDSRGRLYSSGGRGWEAMVVVWDAKGKYLRTIGRKGEGPGEFEGGAVTLNIDGRDYLYVRDYHTWKIFAPDHEFVRTIQAEGAGSDIWRTAILDDESVLEGNWVTFEGTHHFRITDTAGAFRFFAPVKPGNAERARPRRNTHDGDLRGSITSILKRAFAYEGGDVFWAGPVDGDPDGYVLEEWGTDGKKRRSFRRDASWWKTTADPRMSSRVVFLHLHDGLLFVRLTSLDQEGYPENFLTEVIDTRSGELVASTEVHRSREELRAAPAPSVFFRYGMLGYRWDEDEDTLGPDGAGLVVVTIIEAVLEER